MVHLISAPTDSLLTCLLTWIVGTQYYRARIAQGDAIALELDPGNEYDANAIAAYNTDGHTIGHLPRYDAAIFAPLIKRGWIKTHGKITSQPEDHRAPIVITVLITEPGRILFEPHPAGDYPALIHNTLVDAWQKSERYAPAAIKTFRALLRPVTRDGTLPPETRFLHRMLRGRIQDRKAEIQARTFEHLEHLQDTWHLPTLRRFETMSVLPIFLKKPGEAAAPEEPGIQVPHIIEIARPPEILSWDALIPQLFPYAENARGIAIFHEDHLVRLIWTDQAGIMQTHWFNTIFHHGPNPLPGPLSTAYPHPPGDPLTIPLARKRIRKTIARLAINFDDESTGSSGKILFTSPTHEAIAIQTHETIHTLDVRERE